MNILELISLSFVDEHFHGFLSFAIIHGVIKCILVHKSQYKLSYITCKPLVFLEFLAEQMR